MADIHCTIKEYRNYTTNRGTMIIPIFKINSVFDANSNFWILDPPYNISLLAGYNINTNCLPLTGDNFSISASGSTMYYTLTGGGSTINGSASMPQSRYRNFNVGIALVEDSAGNHIFLEPKGGFTVNDFGLAVGVQPTAATVGICSITTGDNKRMWNSTADTTHKNIGAAIYGGSKPISTDPYAGAGDSDVGGGGGSWDDGSDPVPIPSLPSVGAVSTGFISLFVPTLAQLRQVAEYLWSPFFDVSTFYKIFENPMDCILGLSVVPVSVPTSGNAQITVGNIELSGITLPVASQQYVEVNCGTLHPTPYFGSYLDYEPYTKMSLFVPYSGIHTINADDVMNKDITMVYHIDILTGSLVAYLKCGDSVLYEFNGACGSNIPVNSMNYASTIENAVRIAVNIGTTVATAGASAPTTVGATTAAGGVGREIGRGLSLTGSTAEGILSLKPNIDRAGSLGGTTGLLGNQTPYLIITRPRLCKPFNQNKYKGYPSFITYSINDLIGLGYTEFDTIILEGLYLTDEEKNELETILQGGVYL